MRQALPSSGKDASRPKRFPAPIGGWNTSESLADMKPTQAIFLDNFFPRTSDVMLRKGNEQFSLLPVGKEVRTLIGYKSASAVKKTFAAAQDGIYDVTDGAFPLTPDTPATNGEWQYTPISTPGGSFIVMCNGVDKMKLYSGAGWADIDETTVPSLTGLPSNEVVNISKFKTRLILCRKDSLSFWYMPVNSLGGAAVEFPLGALFSEGGYLMATTSWTIDGGNGPDDYFVAITSEGEVALYKGSDPSTASDFGLVGIFKLAKPMSRRCFAKMAGDVAVITRDAVYPLSKSLGIVDNRKSTALTDNIQQAYSEFASKYSDLFGWSITVFSEESMLLVNVPILNMPSRGIIYSYQFVMNLETGAWCRFTNMSAECFLAFDGELYSALHNRVVKSWTGLSDLTGVIVGSAKTAFSAMSSDGNKKIAMIKPLITAGGNLTLQLGIDVDYEQKAFSGSVASYSQSLSLWDEAIWNAATWNGTGIVISNWRSVACKIGRMFSVRLRCSSKDVSMTWIETGLLVEDGGLV